MKAPTLLDNKKRVLVRKPETGDADEFLRLVEASRGFHHPWTNPPRTAADFSFWVARADSERSWFNLLCRRDGGEIVGVINLSEIIRGPLQACFVGFYGFAATAGQGFMTDGLRLVASHALGPFGLHRLEANIQPGNERSKALVQRVGFENEGFSPSYLQIDGEWRDHERWAIRAGMIRPGGRTPDPS